VLPEWRRLKIEESLHDMMYERWMIGRRKPVSKLVERCDRPAGLDESNGNGFCENPSLSRIGNKALDLAGK
jgi:hypothetical protein